MPFALPGAVTSVISTPLVLSGAVISGDCNRRSSLVLQRVLDDGTHVEVDV
jgi:hypothetical protein